MRDSYDAIIIGAGHNGLTLGAYLARSGLDVVVLERRHEEGGGLCTEEITQPGYLHNLHANYHTFVDMAPPVSDLDVRGNGVEYVRPEVQMASIFDDGTALTIHTDLDKTCASLARFSEEDAETFRKNLISRVGAYTLEAERDGISTQGKPDYARVFPSLFERLRNDFIDKRKAIIQRNLETFLAHTDEHKQDQKTEKAASEMRRVLVDRFGYCNHCAMEAMAYLLKQRFSG